MFQSGCELWQKGFTGLSKVWRERERRRVRHVGKGISVVVWTTECSSAAVGGSCSAAGLLFAVSRPSLSF